MTMKISGGQGSSYNFANWGSNSSQSNFVYVGPGSSPSAGGLPDRTTTTPSTRSTGSGTTSSNFQYIGPGSSPAAGGLPDPGMREVREVQEQLLDRGYDLGNQGADGVHGGMTDAAIRAFQRENGLLVDGIVGPQTLAALNGRTADEATEAVLEAEEEVEAAHAHLEEERERTGNNNGHAYNAFALVKPYQQVYDAEDAYEEASAEQYAAFDNQTGSSSASYAEADEAAGVDEDHDLWDEREDALETAVTSEIRSTHQAGARFDYASQELNESITEGAPTDELEEDEERFVTVTANEARFEAGQNEDITHDVYVATRQTQIERGHFADLSQETQEAIVGLTGDALVEARRADPTNENEQNSQTTADIYDASFLQFIRNDLATPTGFGPAPYDDDIVNVDLRLNASIEGIAEAIRESDPETRRAFEALIASQQLTHELDVSVPGVTTEGGNSLATGMADQDVLRAVMLRERDMIVQSLADHHDAYADASDLTVQGNYLFQRVIATDERASELNAQFAAAYENLPEDGSVPAPYMFGVADTLGHMMVGSESAHIALQDWAVLRPTFDLPDVNRDQYTISTDGSGREVVLNGEIVLITEESFEELSERYGYEEPEAADHNTVNLTMRQYHRRELDLISEDLEILEEERDRLLAIDNPDILETNRLAAVEQEIGALRVAKQGHTDLEEDLGFSISTYQEAIEFARLAEDADPGPNDFTIMRTDRDTNGDTTVKISGSAPGDPTNANRHNAKIFVALENENGSIFNPAAGIFFDPYNPPPGFTQDNDGGWKFEGVYEDYSYTYEHKFSERTGNFQIANLSFRLEEGGSVTLSYDVIGNTGVPQRVTGTLNDSEARVWQQTGMVEQTITEQERFRGAIIGVGPEVSGEWRMRINSNNAEDREAASSEEANLLDATEALEQAETAYFDDPNDANLEARIEASHDWSVAHAELLNHQAAGGVASAEAALQRARENHAPREVLDELEKALTDAQRKLAETANYESNQYEIERTGGDFTASAEMQFFAENPEAATQSTFNQFALDSGQTDIEGGAASAIDYVSRQIVGDSFEDLAADDSRRELLTTLGEAINRVSDGEGATVNAFPIMREQVIDGRSQLVLDVLFRVEGNNGNTAIVDVDGRDYNDEHDFRNNNKTIEAEGEADLIMPEEGRLDYDDEGHVILTAGDGRIESGWEKFRREKHVDTVVGIAGITAGVILMATGAGAPLGTLLVASGVAVAGGAAAYGVATSGMDIHDRVTHGESWTSKENLLNYGNIAAAVLPSGSLVRGGRAALQTRSALKAATSLPGAPQYHSLTALTGRNVLGGTDEFATLVQNTRATALADVTGDGFASRYLVDGASRVGGGIGSGLTVHDAITLANHIENHGMEGLNWADIGLTLADLGIETPGVASAIRFAGPRPHIAPADLGPGRVVDPNSEGFSNMQDVFTSAVDQGSSTVDLADGHRVVFSRADSDPLRAQTAHYDVEIRDATGSVQERFRAAVDQNGTLTQLIDDTNPANSTGPHEVEVGEAVEQVSVDPSEPAAIVPRQNELLTVFQEAVPTFKKDGDHPQQVIVRLDDGSRVLLRKDFGDRSHGMDDHYNLELQNERGKTIENLHIFLDEDGNITRVTDLNGNPHPMLAPQEPERTYTTLAEDFQNQPQYLQRYLEYLEEHQDGYNAWIADGSNGLPPTPRPPVDYIATRKVFDGINTPHSTLQASHLDYVRQHYPDLIELEKFSTYPAGFDRAENPNGRPGLPDSAFFDPADNSLHIFEFKTGETGHVSELQSGIAADPGSATLSAAAAKRLNADPQMNPELIKDRFTAGMYLIEAFPGGVTWSEIRKPHGSRGVSQTQTSLSSDGSGGGSPRANDGLGTNQTNSSPDLPETNGPDDTGPDTGTSGVGGDGGDIPINPSAGGMIEPPDGDGDGTNSETGPNSDDPEQVATDKVQTANAEPDPQVELSTAELEPASTNWRDAIGQTDPMTFLTPEGSWLGSHWTRGRIMNGTLTPEATSSVLDSVISNPDAGPISDKLRQIRYVDGETYDAITTYISTRIKQRATTEGANWFEALPRRVQADAWAQVDERDMPGFAFLSETEQALLLLYKGKWSEQLTDFRNGLTENRGLRREYARYRQEPGNDHLPMTLDEYVAGLQKDVENGRFEGVESSRMIPILLSKQKSQHEYPKDAMLLTLLLGSALGPDSAEAFIEAGTTVASGTLGKDPSDSDAIARRNRLSRDASIGGLAGGAAGLADAAINLDGAEFALDFPGLVLDALRLRQRQNQIGGTEKLNEALLPHLRMLDADQHGYGEHDPETLIPALQHEANQVWQTERKTTDLRTALLGVSDWLRMVDLGTYAYQNGSSSAVALSAALGLPPYLLANARATRRDLTVRRSMIDTINATERGEDLGAQIRTAGSLEEVITSVPIHASIESDPWKPDGVSRASELRMWMNGDKETAHSINRLYLTQEGIGTWKIEYFVTDLLGREPNASVGETHVFEKTFEGVNPFHNIWHTKADPAYRWKESEWIQNASKVQSWGVATDGLLEMGSLGSTIGINSDVPYTPGTIPSIPWWQAMRTSAEYNWDRLRGRYSDTPNETPDLGSGDGEEGGSDGVRGHEA
ncbi:MAG: peptidoglycan-binding protein [Pseudomonadota bacterium]